MNSSFWGTIRLINGWFINLDKSVWRTVDNLKAKLTCHFLAVEIVRTTMDLFMGILHRNHPVTIFTKTSKYSTHDGLLRLIPKIWIDYILTVWRPFCVIRKISCQINNVIGKKKITNSDTSQCHTIAHCSRPFCFYQRYSRPSNHNKQMIPGLQFERFCENDNREIWLLSAQYTLQCTL